MKFGKAMLSLAAVGVGIAVASPAQAVLVHRQFHVKFAVHAAAPNKSDVKTDVVKTDVVKTDATAKGLDCGSGAYTADGAEVPSSDVTSISDGEGGCKVSAAIDSAVSDFILVFNDAAGTPHKFNRKFVKEDNAPGHVIDVREF